MYRGRASCRRSARRRRTKAGETPSSRGRRGTPAEWPERGLAACGSCRNGARRECREAQADDQAAALSVGQVDPAAVSIHDARDDGEAEARARRLGRRATLKPLENPRPVGLLYAGAAVGYREAMGGVGAVGEQADDDAAAGTGAAVADGVVQHVLDRFSQHHGVAVDRGAVGGVAEVEDRKSTRLNY